MEGNNYSSTHIHSKAMYALKCRFYRALCSFAVYPLPAFSAEARLSCSSVRRSACRCKSQRLARDGAQHAGSADGLDRSPAHAACYVTRRGAETTVACGRRKRAARRSTRGSNRACACRKAQTHLGAVGRIFLWMRHFVTQAPSRARRFRGHFERGRSGIHREEVDAKSVLSPQWLSRRS